MSTVAELEAENARLRRILAGDLPLDLDGKPIRWEPWETCPPITHIDTACHECTADRHSIALGAGPDGLRSYRAIRCGGCRLTVVYRFDPGRPGTRFGRLVEAWRNRGQGELF